MIPKESEAVSQSRSSLAALADCGAASPTGAHGVQLHAQGPLAWASGLQQVCMSNLLICEHLCCPLFHGLSWPAALEGLNQVVLRMDSWSSKATCLPIVFRMSSVADDDSLTHKLCTTQCSTRFVRPNESRSSRCLSYAYFA